MLYMQTKIEIVNDVITIKHNDLHRICTGGEICFFSGLLMTSF